MNPLPQTKLKNMVAKNLLHDVLSLPVADRMELCTRLSENLQAEPLAPPITQDQAVELDRRHVESLENPEVGYSVEEVETMLKARRKQ